jgi:hypothetical protein
MEMVVRCLTADYGSIAALTKRVAEKLSRGSKFKVESELGTSLELERQDRTVGADTGLLTQRADFGNLPAGEAFFPPMEGTANGKIVFDGSVADVGILAEPIELQVEAVLRGSSQPPRRLRSLTATSRRMGPTLITSPAWKYLRTCSGNPFLAFRCLSLQPYLAGRLLRKQEPSYLVYPL